MIAEASQHLASVAVHLRVELENWKARVKAGDKERVELCKVVAIHQPSVPILVFASQDFRCEWNLSARLLENPPPLDQQHLQEAVGVAQRLAATKQATYSLGQRFVGRRL